MPFPIRLLCLLVGAATVPLLAATQESVHYWNGKHRVLLELALDELDVAPERAVGERLARAVPGAALAPGAPASLRFAGVDRAALVAQAVAVAAAGGAPRAVLYADAAVRSPQARHVLTTRLALRLRPGQDLAALARAHGFQPLEEVGAETWIASTSGGPLAALECANRLYETAGVVFASPLITHPVVLRTTPADPLFAQQWHLLNTAQLGAGTTGHDINVAPVWNFASGTGLGAGINLGIVDSGVQISHPDLAANCAAGLHTNILVTPDNGNPNPTSNDAYHGSAVAGMAAARDSNGVGGVGVAPRATIFGIRLIAAGNVGDDAEQRAMEWKVPSLAQPLPLSQQVHASNNSWGVPDDGMVLEGPGVLMNTGLASGVTRGRGGRGVVYVWAAGNGYEVLDPVPGVDAAEVDSDTADYDGYASSRYVIAVGASRHDGRYASYSEGGACLLVNAPGGDGGGKGVVTTDMVGSGGIVGGDYFAASNTLAGTSFAAPVVAGVVALLLEANPALTWRDVKHVLARTATKNDPTDPNWFDNHASTPRHWNYYYGFGRVDAAAAVAAARTWTGVPAEVAPRTASNSTAAAIADLATISRTCTIAPLAGFRAEVVELHVNLTHPARGDLSFRLTSPQGTTVHIRGRAFDTGDNYDWTFTSVATLGEDPAGTWTLAITDAIANDAGTLVSWDLAVHGYVPHQAPVFTNVTPRVGEDLPSATITVNGTGFVEGVTRVRWDLTGVPTDLVTTWVSATEVSAVVPGSLLTTPGVFGVTVVNPDFDGGADHVAAASSVVTVDAKPFFAGVPATLTIAEDSSSPSTAFTIGDTFTPAANLTLTASSSNPSLVANAGLQLTGGGAGRSITVTPVGDATGTATITLLLEDGFGQAATTIVVTVTPANDPPVALDGVFELSGSNLSGQVAGYDIDQPQQLLSTSEVTDTADGDVVFTTATGAFTYTRPLGFTGLTTFTWRLSDGVVFSQNATATLVINADPSFPRPIFTSQPDDEIVSEGVDWDYDLTVSTSAYVGTPPTITYELAGAPPGMTISGNQIIWDNPLPPAGGTHVSVIVVARDSTPAHALGWQRLLLRVVAAGAPN